MSGRSEVVSPFAEAESDIAPLAPVFGPLLPLLLLLLPLTPRWILSVEPRGRGEAILWTNERIVLLSREPSSVVDIVFGG
jgi:hypothetical protein